MSDSKFKNIVLLLMNKDFVERFRSKVSEKYEERKWPSPKDCGKIATEVINDMFEGM